jgi:predicted nuclease of predicted toxin-antitoxin system
VNILLDECVPARLARELAPHSVTTVQRRGWAGIKNGDLLALAQNEFDVLITVDRNVSEEQDLTHFTIALVLLRAATNRLEHLRPLAGKVLEKLADAPAGVVSVVSS